MKKKSGKKVISLLLTGLMLVGSSAAVFAQEGEEPKVLQELQAVPAEQSEAKTNETGIETGNEPVTEMGNGLETEAGNKPEPETENKSEAESGNEPEAETGNEVKTETEPGTETGKEPGTETGNEPGTETGKDSGAAGSGAGTAAEINNGAAEGEPEEAKLTSPVKGFEALGVMFRMVGNGPQIGKVHFEKCPFNSKEPEKSFSFKASDFESMLEDGYSILNPDQDFTASYVKTEDGRYELTPSMINIEVQKDMPDTVPVLNVEYRLYSKSFGNIHYGDYTVVYTEQIGNLTMDRTHYNGNTEALSQIGYAITNDALYPAKKVLSLNCYDNESWLPDFQTPWIPSNFLEWKSGVVPAYPLNDGYIPFPVCDDTIVFVVDKNGEIQGDNQVKVGFKTKDGTVVGNSYMMEVNPAVGTLTIDKNNIPPLPSGYQLADQNETHTVTYTFDGESWVLSEREVYFTVEKSGKDPVINPVKPTPKPGQNTPPSINGTAKTVSPASAAVKTVSPKTADDNNIMLYICVMGAAACIAGIAAIKKGCRR